MTRPADMLWCPDPMLHGSLMPPEVSPDGGHRCPLCGFRVHMTPMLAIHIAHAPAWDDDDIDQEVLS